MRRAAKKDTTEKPIVKGLRDLGYIVVVLGKPVDIAVTRTSWGNVWMFAENKTPNRAGGKYEPRSDQKEQAEFCKAHGVPYWLTLEQAHRDLISFADWQKL